MRPALRVAAALLLTAAPAVAVTTPEPANVLVARASARAAKSGKNVLVLFHASWCRWCKRLEQFTVADGIKPALEASYELVWLDVQERGDKKALENPGADSMYATWNGPGGLPFYVVLAPGGKVLGDGSKIGFPATAEEVDAFIDLVRTTAPRVQPADLERMRAFLAPKAP